MLSLNFPVSRLNTPRSLYSPWYNNITCWSCRILIKMRWTRPLGSWRKNFPAIPDSQRAWGLCLPTPAWTIGKVRKDTLFCYDHISWPMQQKPSGLFNNAVIKVLFYLYFGAWAYNFTFLIINLSLSSCLEFLFICAIKFLLIPNWKYNAPYNYFLFKLYDCIPYVLYFTI